VSAPDRPRRIWITRTLPQAAETAERVLAMGLAPVVAPVIEAQYELNATIDLAGFDALAFTSRHAVEGFARRSRERSLSVFTVGAATADWARAAGFTPVTSADGDVNALAELIAGADPRPARVLNPTAREPAADLAALLAGRGVTVVPLVVYATVRRPFRETLGQFDAVLVHSARAARALAADLTGDTEASRIDAYAISEAAAEPLRALGLRSVSVALRPDEASLLALLKV
jgi:uroporphyrinogen-III synthase